MSQPIEILASQELPDGFVLDEIGEIEEILEAIAGLEAKKETFEQIKKHRISVADYKITNIKNRITRLRQIILNTMLKLAPNTKMIDFAPIGKVMRRKAKKKSTHAT